MSYSLKTAVGIFVFFLITYALSMACVFFAFSDIAEKRFTATAYSSAEAAAESAAFTVETLRSDSIGIAESITRLKDTEKTAVLSSFMSSKPDILSIVVTDKNGWSWFALNRSDVTPVGTDFSSHKSVAEVLKNGKGFVYIATDPSHEDTPFLESALPLTETGDKTGRGVLKIKSSLERLKNVISATPQPEVKTVFVISESGLVISSESLSFDKKAVLVGAVLKSVETQPVHISESLIVAKQFNASGIEMFAVSYIPESIIRSFAKDYFIKILTVSFFLFLVTAPLAFIFVRSNRSPFDNFAEKVKKAAAVLDPIESERGKKSDEEYASHVLAALSDTVHVLRDIVSQNDNAIAKAVEKQTSAFQAEIAELQRRLKEEYSKNTKKDQMMIRQSRLAAMGEMISNIAHQWRQPLNALALTIQDIEDSYRHNEINDSYIAETVEKSMELIQHMSMTIDDFRNFYKTNKDIVEFSLKRSVEEAMKVIGASMKNSNIEVVLECDTDVTVNGYPNEFSQVVLNILSNSKDALLDNRLSDRRITITIKDAENGRGRLIITDNGGGIPANVIENVFDPYFTTKEQGKGTGIGLYMSKTIIENNMGGKIDITNIGDGTKVTIEI